MILSHDRLQQQCYTHLRNVYPHLRYCYWAVINETIPVGRETPQQTAIRANRLKSIGLEPGVWDMVMYYAGVLHIFDFKVGTDTLSEKQLRFQAAIEAQGGKSYVIETEEQFIAIIAGITGPTSAKK